MDVFLPGVLLAIFWGGVACLIFGWAVIAAAGGMAFGFFGWLWALSMAHAAAEQWKRMPNE